MNRRTFLATSTVAVAAGLNTTAGDTAKLRRIAVIGHSGRGNYGHGLDTVWHKIPEAQLVAVADANESGLAAELKKLRIETGYSDYRKMLADVRPEFVSVAPRHADQHHDMAMAAIQSGVKGLYIEKPFAYARGGGLAYRGLRAARSQTRRGASQPIPPSPCAGRRTHQWW